MISGDTLIEVEINIDGARLGKAYMIADRLTTLNQVVIGVGSYAKQMELRGAETLHHGLIMVGFTLGKLATYDLN